MSTHIFWEYRVIQLPGFTIPSDCPQDCIWCPLPEDYEALAAEHECILNEWGKARWEVYDQNAVGVYMKRPRDLFSS